MITKRSQLSGNMRPTSWPREQDKKRKDEQEEHRVGWEVLCVHGREVAVVGVEAKGVYKQRQWRRRMFSTKYQGLTTMPSDDIRGGLVDPDVNRLDILTDIHNIRH